ncbi:MAG TPA: hypothetical protein QF626_04045, partial [Prochlorococcaceae cyanobacterium Fu_MAG_50]|nr:hypothetical protein [Prochlorococcaceae cyanobacterium Fu_MAG_50]
MGTSVSGAKVSLWQSSTKDGARKISETKTSQNGDFKLSRPQRENQVTYLIAEGGTVGEQKAE